MTFMLPASYRAFMFSSMHSGRFGLAALVLGAVLSVPVPAYAAPLAVVSTAANTTANTTVNTATGKATGTVTSLSASDEKAVREVVAAQLAAFAADDAPKAFSVAAPNIQKMFKTPANFMAMVQAHYPVVYRPASVTYYKPETDGASIIMKVQMLDANDAQWLAVYALQRPNSKDKTKGWRIAGCIVTSNVGRTA